MRLNLMSKPTKSQWDFGELFPTESRSAGRQVLSVSELTAQVKRLLEKQVGQVWVTGEVTNLRAQSSGHMYFTLKDAAAQLSCVLFRGAAIARRELGCKCCAGSASRLRAGRVEQSRGCSDRR